MIASYILNVVIYTIFSIYCLAIKTSSTAFKDIDSRMRNTINDSGIYKDKLDLKNYLSNSIIMNPRDWATFELGINDMFNYFDTASAGFAARACVLSINSLILQFQEDVPGLRIAILMPAPPANQDAFGINYGTSQTAWRYWSNLNIYYKYVLEAFDTPLQRLNGVYILGLGVTLDRLHNIEKASVNINSRNKATYWRAQNGVHPADSGYAQYADTYYSFLKWYK